ncbi:MAG TPA: STAS domain-containing protein [Candidatus Polarisedimenticolia bacterium]|nr:STAS domain-containing protein [Candidatus Polarisedimenticolia bacterium]
MGAGENRLTSINMRVTGKIAVIEVIGNLYLEKGAPELREATHEALKADLRQILIDLRRTVAIDSGGIGELVASKWAAVDKGGDIALLAPTSKVRAALELVHLSHILKVYDSEPSAMKALGVERTR